MVRREVVVCALAASVAGAAGVLSGCVPPRQEAFAPVEATVHERTGLHIAWRGRAVEGAALRRHLRALLKKPLTADTAVEIALLNNSDLQAALDAVGISLGDVAEASVPSNPLVSANVRWPTSGSGTAVELHAAQDLVSILTLRGRRDAAFASLDAARAGAAAAVIDLVARVRDAFYNVQATNQVLQLRKTVRDSLSAQLAFTKRIYKAGNIAKLAVSQQQALLDEAHLDLSRAKTAMVVARERLNALLGLTGKATTWTLTAKLPDLPPRADDLSDLEQVAVARSLRMQQERGRMRAASDRLGVARLEAWLPAFGPGVSAQKEVGSAWTVGPELFLSIPLFDRKQGVRVRENARLRRAQHREAALAVTIRAAARAARSELHSAYSRARFARDNLLPTRQMVLNETLRQYNAMNASPFELVQAERDRIAASIQSIETLRDYWRARVRVEQIRAGSAAAGMNQGGIR